MLDCVSRVLVSTIPKPLTLTHQTVTGMMIHLLQNQSANVKRWLGLLLVVFILYGTTVEAAHRHGRVLPTGARSASLVTSEHSSTLLVSKAGCSDCLICQLHQNFNTTLIVFRLVDSPYQPQVRISTAVPSDVLSQVTGPTAGRAPPSIS
jgi:hypothetical protein